MLANNFYYPAHYELLRNDLLFFNRLYAFPNKPTITNDCKIILDSGAFHMHKAKKPINEQYAIKLIEHYKKYSHLDNVYCITADTPKNFSKSLQLTEMMITEIKSICPVLHNSQKGCIDLFSLKKQIKIYSIICQDRFIALSNNDLSPEIQKKELKYIIEMAKDYFKHFHVFGAGFSAQNVLSWKNTGADSVDSIGYYTDALKGVVWNSAYSDCDTFKNMSLKNLKEANRLCC